MSLDDYQTFYTLSIDIKLTICELTSHMYNTTLEDEHGTKYLIWLQEYVAELVKRNKWLCNITYHGYDKDPVWTITKKKCVI